MWNGVFEMIYMYVMYNIYILISSDEFKTDKSGRKKDIHRHHHYPPPKKKKERKKKRKEFHHKSAGSNARRN